MRDTILWFLCFDGCLQTAIRNLRQAVSATCRKLRLAYSGKILLGSFYLYLHNVTNQGRVPETGEKL